MKRAMVWMAAGMSLLLLVGSQARADQGPSFEVAPKVVNIDAFYNGGRLKVTGTIPAGADVVIRVLGQTKEMHLKQKGKAFGLLWMNLGSLTVSGVPEVCLVYSNRELSRLAGPEGATGPVSELGLTGLGQQAVLEPPSEDKAALFEELVKLKKKGDLFDEQGNGVQIRDEAGKGRVFQGDISLPSKLPPEEYRVQVFAVEEGRIIGQAEKTLKVEMVGLPRMMAALAFDHGALFGVMASVIAILGGLIISLLFKGGGKGGH